jgi:hypothetical protein
MMAKMSGDVLAFALQLQAQRDHRLPGRILERGPVGARQLKEAGQVDQPIDSVDILRAQVQLTHEELTVVFRHRAVHLQPCDRGKTPLAQLSGDHLQQVFGLLLVAAHVGVARHAEGMDAHNLHAGEKFVDVCGDELLDGQEVRLFFGGAAFIGRHGEQARARQLDARKVRRLLFAVAQHHRQRQAEVGDEGKRMSRIDGQRRQHLVDLGMEPFVQQGALPRAEVAVVQQVYASLGRQARLEFTLPQRGHAAVNLDGSVVEQAQLLGGCAPVVGELAHLRRLLPAQPADALLHKLVEVAGRDRHKLDAFQQRRACVHRQRQHAPVEIDPTQLLVEVQAWFVERGVVGRRRRIDGA